MPAHSESRAPSFANGDEDIEHTRVSSRAPRRAGVHHLSFDTGEVIEAMGPGVIGRAPVAGPGEHMEHFVAISDPDKSVSKTHLAFGTDQHGLWVEDKGSTNGTELVVAGGVSIPVAQGQRVAVPDGATVRFGERSFTVRKG